MSASVDDISSYLSTNSGVTQLDTGSTLDYNDFLSLLTAELSNQDPTDPVDNKDLVLQMSQFSTLSSLATLNDNFESFISTNTISTLNGIIGREVTYNTTTTDDEGNKSTTSTTGKCTGINIADDGTVSLTVGGAKVSTGQISGIANPTTSETSE